MKIAIILLAVEENLAEENTEKSPTSYFVSFLGLLDQSVSTTGISNSSLATPALYFLSLVAPYVSNNILRAKFSSILSKISPVLTDPKADAPILKSSIGVLETLLCAQDTNSWSVSSSEASPKRGLIGLMAFSLDPRPKVRKKAQDAIFTILSKSPSGPSLSHPSGSLCAENMLQYMDLFLKDGQKKKHIAITSEDENSSQLIHILKLTNVIVKTGSWPLSLTEPLCQRLLNASKSSEKYLVTAAFEVFESLFTFMAREKKSSEKFKQLLESILDLIPNCDSHDNQTLAPAWLLVVSSAIEAYTSIDPHGSFVILPKVFKLVSEFFNSQNIDIQKSTTQCLIVLCEKGIAQSELTKENSEETDQILGSISSQTFGLLNVRYQSSWKDIMSIIVSLSDSLMWRSDPYLINCFKVVEALRSTESFSDGWNDTEMVIGAAIRNIGPEKTLELFPLNIDGFSNPPRPWLLPLLRDNIKYSELRIFKEYFVGLSGKIEALSEGLKNRLGNLSKTEATDLKTYETLIDQIWSLFPSFCYLPLDLKDEFNQEFPNLLMNIVYNYPNMRGYIFNGLRLLVECNRDYVNSVTGNLQLLKKLSKNDATNNLHYLSTFSLNILASLFNVFAVTPMDSRVQLLECLKAFLSVTSREDLETTFNRVSSALDDSLKLPLSGSDNDNGIPPTSATMLDIIIQMVPFLPKQSFDALLRIFVTVSRNHQDPLLQKRSYRLFSSIIEQTYGSDILKLHINDLIELFLETSDYVGATARSTRLNAISQFFLILPKDSLHFIPAIVSEVVIGTKDLNDKTRQFSFSLLVQMGNIMKSGGEIDRSKIPGMPSDAVSVPASLEEYITIIAAGLSETTTLTQSGTILALTKVVFDFRQDLNLQLLQELTNMIEMFLDNKSREVAEATLGFVKVAVISLPREVIKPNLKRLIEQLLSWYREHSSRFKSKIKHLIERLIRQFGFEVISNNFPEDDLKFLNNIRKSKERAKRKKSQATVIGNETESLESHRNRKHFVKATKFESEFDRALYGSSSEDSDSDSEIKELDSVNSGRKVRVNKYILEGADPLDLLDQKALAYISSEKPSGKKKKPAIPDDKKFKKNAEGRLIIKNSQNESDDPLSNITSSLSAYEEAIKTGPVRDERGIYRYKRGRHNMDDGDNLSDDDLSSKKATISSRKTTGNKNRGFKGSAKRKNISGHRRFYN